jgi:hypothetical protein
MTMKNHFHHSSASTPDRGKMNFWRFVAILGSALFIVGLLAGTLRNPHFWLTANQRGDHLFREQKFSEAAKSYTDPCITRLFAPFRPLHLQPLNPLPQFHQRSRL